MKFIHTADLHLDSKINGIPTDKSRIRREEIVRTFEKMVDYASEHEVRAIIIAGDMFDTSGITIKTKNTLFCPIISKALINLNLIIKHLNKKISY